VHIGQAEAQAQAGRQDFARLFERVGRVDGLDDGFEELRPRAVGRRKLGVGNWRLEAGSWKLARS
jgi:hypothetical protein